MKRIIAINQPTFLPWLGYFELMIKSDMFIFLDTVQFTKPSWQNRNRINTNDGPTFITLPTKRKDVQTKLLDVCVLFNRDFDKMLNKIYQSYKKAPYFSALEEIIFSYFEVTRNSSQTISLSEFNINLILRILKYLNINKKVLQASADPFNSSKCDRLIYYCRKHECNIYLSPNGSAKYLSDELDLFNKNNIDVLIQSYIPSAYETDYEFVPALSIIDLIAYHGKTSYDIICSGFNSFQEL